MAPFGASVGSLCGLLRDPSDVQLGDFVPSSKLYDTNLGISWVTLSPLGSGLASFGYLVCESSLFVLSLEATG